MSRSAKLTSEQVAASRESGRQYEANMAIEGLVLTAEERAFFDRLDNDAVGYEDGVQRTVEFLKARGVIPTTADLIAAE